MRSRGRGARQPVELIDPRTSECIDATRDALLSQALTLEPGDLITTGTPPGVGEGFNPKRYLKPGDVVRVEIDGLGHIENRVVAEPDDTAFIDP